MSKCFLCVFVAMQGLLYAGDDTLFESTGLYGEVIVCLFVCPCNNLFLIINLHNAFFLFPLPVFSEESGSPDREGMFFVLWFDGKHVCIWI